MIKNFFIFIILAFVLIMSNDFFGYEENNTNITFIHIPKNAGTSIEYVGYKNNYKWGKYHFHNFRSVYLVDQILYYFNTDYQGSLINRFINFLATVFEAKHHSPKYYKNSKKLTNNKISFMVVRNPYKKMISIYRFLNKDSSININTFIKKNITDLKHNIKKKNFTYFFYPQHEYLLNNTEILRFENLQEDFKNFCSKHNLKTMELPKVNVTSYKYNITIDNLNNESINLINDFYSKDFELFNYNKINAK